MCGLDYHDLLIFLFNKICNNSKICKNIQMIRYKPDPNTKKKERTIQNCTWSLSLLEPFLYKKLKKDTS
jgi:hypothetical protein